MGKLFFSFVITGLLFSACVTTRFTSYTDPSYYSYKLKFIAVFAPGFDLDTRKTLENAIVKHLKEYKVNAFSSLDVFPPTRDYELSFIQDKLSKSKCNAVLIVTLKDANTGFSTMLHQTLVAQNSLYTFPVGYKYRTSEFITEIYDKRIEGRIWMSESKTKAEGSLYTDVKTTLDNYASSMVKELIKCRHIYQN